MIYADYNATTPIYPEVTQAMQPYFTEEFGNPSSKAYQLGRNASRALEHAREQVAALLGAHPGEVIFMSGGTESCFTALVGYLLKNQARRHLVYSAVEHPAVVEAARFLNRFHGCEFSEVATGAKGYVDVDDLNASLRPETSVGSFMLANNESGAIFPLGALAKGLKSNGSASHTDATQTVGKLVINFHELGVDFLSCSGHKFGAPKGVGILLAREGTAWEPILRGGSQEKGRRGGTEAIALIVGVGKAAELSRQRLTSGYFDRVKALRDSFEQKLQQKVADVDFTLPHDARLPNTCSVAIRGIAGHELVEGLGSQGIMISAGSACKTGTAEPSRVLTAMQRSIFDCLATIRVSFGACSTESEVHQLVEAIASQTQMLRSRLNLSEKMN